jgi:hypothetical protein
MALIILQVKNTQRRKLPSKLDRANPVCTLANGNDAGDVRTRDKVERRLI